MSAGLLESLWALSVRLKTLAAEDPALRQAIQSVAQALLDLAKPAAPPPEMPPDPDVPCPDAGAQPDDCGSATALTPRESASLALPSPPAPEPAAVRQDLQPRVDEDAAPRFPAEPVAEPPNRSSAASAGVLQTGSYSPPLPTSGDAPAQGVADSGELTPLSAREASDAIDLGMVIRRCRLKAQGATWVYRSARAATADQEDLRDEYHQLIAQARLLPHCFLWMIYRDWVMPRPQCARWDLVAGCFEAVASAAELTLSTNDNAEWEPAAQLLAEAQAALRLVLEDVSSDPELDQAKAFYWLRAQRERRRIMLERYMTLDDRPDPASWPDLMQRVDRLRTEMAQRRRKAKSVSRDLGKIKYLAARLADASDSSSGWPHLLGKIDELIGSGNVSPSHPDLREALLPLLDSLPLSPPLPQSVARVLVAIDQYVASRPDEEPQVPLQDTEEVRSVRELLHNRTIVLIGGNPRRHGADNLRRAFALKDLDWIYTEEHEWVESFHPRIARPEVALVLLATRWASHSYKNLKPFCDSCGKPFVILPAGYSPNRVAEEILKQASKKLSCHPDYCPSR